MPRRCLNPEWALRVSAKIRRPVPGDGDAGRVAGMFGLRQGLTETLYADTEIRISPGQIIAVVGPSGGGKSVLLRRIAAQARWAIRVQVSSLSRCDRPAVSVLRGGRLAERLEVLSRCGLADAAALITPARRLSGGQLYRLALGRALHAARRRARPVLLIADEFASSLDSATATILCEQMRKLITRSCVAMVAATPRAELLESLRPDEVVTKPLGEAAWVSPFVGAGTSNRNGPRRWPIVTGLIADYDALSAFHYLAGRPAAHKRVYAIRAPRKTVAVGGPAVAAVLVVSPPLANVRGRNLATGGRYAGPDRAAAMTMLNAEVECISRVVVHPVYRGCGLAVRLVRRAIAESPTPLMEALAAMGAVHPFFEKAGMRAYPLGPDESIARFISAAEAVGLAAEQLPAVEPVKRMLARRRRKAARFLEKELGLCIRKTFSPAQLSRLDDPVAEICRRTARQYVYYLRHVPKEPAACKLPHARSRGRAESP